MEAEIMGILDSLEARTPDFRGQVERAREFRERLKEAGVVPHQEQFSIPLMERLETPQDRRLCVLVES